MKNNKYNLVKACALAFLGFSVGFSVANSRKSKANVTEKDMAQISMEEDDVKTIPISSLSEEIVITRFGLVDSSKASIYNEGEAHNLEALRVVTGNKSTFHILPKDLTNRWKLEIPSKKIIVFLQEK